MKYIIFSILVLFFLKNIAAQNYVTYHPYPINRAYPYQAIYLDTINRFYYITEVGLSEGTYKVLNDSMIELKPIIENPYSVEMSYRKKFITCKKTNDKLFFKIKHHLIKNNPNFNFNHRNELKIENCFSAVYAELSDGRVYIVPFSEAKLHIRKKHVTVSGWIKEIPFTSRSISFVPLSTYVNASKSGSFAVPIEKVLGNHGYKTSTINNVDTKKDVCIYAETLFMNYEQWTYLGSAIEDRGDTLVFSSDTKEFAKLLAYGWNLQKTKKLPPPEKIATLKSIKKISRLYSRFRI
jgi:hypothetical protein